jgi:hypothetical protein
MRNLILLLSLLLINPSNAEEATSGNLLPNAGTGTTSLQNQSGSVDGINGSTGWTTTGTTTFNNEIEANGTGTVSATGSLENITTTKSDGSLFTTTTDSLDGGVRLNSTTEVQNCEWSGSAYQCGQATNGRDSYSTTVTILDENNNSLSTVTQNRNNDAGYYDNTYIYTDTVIHNDTGARNWSWVWTGIDGNDTNSTNPVAPNLLGAELTATLLNIDYSPLPTAIQTELISFNNEIIQEFKEFEKEFKFEEEFKNTTVMKFEEEKIEEFTYIPMEMFEEEPKLETPTTAFQEMALYTETMKEEPTEEMKEIFSEIVEESSEEKASEDSSSLQAEQLSSEEQDKEKQTLPQKQQTKQVANDNKNTSSGGVKLISLNKVMDKIDAKVKEIDKNLQLKNLVKINAMKSNNILKDYNVPFYKQRKIYTDQPNIVDNRVIYANNLSTYIQNDPIAKREDYLYRINLEKQKLLNELEVLKNG